jgi:hypothetical protein
MQMTQTTQTFFSRGMALLALAFVASACSSTSPVKTTAYAQLSDKRTFEYDFSVVWRAIEEVFREYKVVARDPEEVTPLEMRKLERRTLKTEWAYGKSRDKYQEYMVNGTPRKVNLQERRRYQVDARKVMGGVEVKIETDEEIEKLKANGNPDGFHAVDKPDPSRADEILNKIGAKILSAPPTQDDSR